MLQSLCFYCIEYLRIPMCWLMTILVGIETICVIARVCHRNLYLLPCRSDFSEGRTPQEIPRHNRACRELLHVRYVPKKSESSWPIWYTQSLKTWFDVPTFSRKTMHNSPGLPRRRVSPCLGSSRAFPTVSREIVPFSVPLPRKVVYGRGLKGDVVHVNGFIFDLDREMCNNPEMSRLCHWKEQRWHGSFNIKNTDRSTCTMLAGDITR